MQTVSLPGHLACRQAGENTTKHAFAYHYDNIMVIILYRPAKYVTA